MSHPHNTRRRGSVLMMVVGLLTIIAMLGATFLVVAHLDRQQSQAISAKAPTDPAVEGVVNQIQSKLLEDLRIAGGRPYDDTAMGSGDTAWKKFIDAATPDNENAIPAKVFDQHLASANWYPVWDTAAGKWVWRWAHLTRLTSEGNEADYKDVALDTTSPRHVDTDGDGVRDAYLFETGIANDQGEKYYAAVRLIDLSALANVNTAAQPDGASMPAITSPVHGNLVRILRPEIANPTADDQPYKNIHAARAGNSAVSVKDLSEKSATRLLSPSEAAFKPFAIGDEMHLRWLAPAAANAPTRNGRLHDTLKAANQNIEAVTFAGQTADLRRYLTTHNTTRLLIRNADGGDWTGVLELQKNAFFTDNAEREKVYKRVKSLVDWAYSGVAADDRRMMAAAFVANLWAYQKEDSDTNAPFHFQPSDAGPEIHAYGQPEPEVFITELYAKAERDAGGNRKAVQAVEVTFVGSADSVGLGNYKLIVGQGGTAKTIDLAGTLSKSSMAERKKVFYTLTNTDVSFITFGAGAVTAEVSDIDLTKTITLVKTIGGVDIPVDQTGANLNPNPANGETQDACWRKNDTIADCQYAIDAWKKTSGVTPGTGLVEHDLGLDNAAARTDITDALHPIKLIRSKKNLQNIGELGLVFLAGPVVKKTGANTEYSALPRQLIANTAFTDAPSRGRFDFTPAAVSAAGYNGGKYPNVAIANLLGEMFTVLGGDSTRPDEDRRLYGRVNINTADEYVLRHLPWPTSLNIGGTSIDLRNRPDDPTRDDIGLLVKFITAYRNRSAVSWNDFTLASGASIGAGSVNFADRVSATGITGLRTGDGDFDGFLTSGELAIPLAKYFDTFFGMAWGMAPPLAQRPDYVQTRNSLYTAVSNLVTVNSDTYAAYILIQLQPQGESDLTKYKARWNYLTVLDRSNCKTATDTPARLLMTQVK